jgi:hypothetical protein
LIQRLTSEEAYGEAASLDQPVAPSAGQVEAHNEDPYIAATTVPEASRINREMINKIASLKPGSLTIEAFVETRRAVTGILPQLLLLEV